MSNTHTANSQFNDIVCNSIRNLDGLVFFGDPHGQFAQLLRTGLAETTKCLFILGDFFDREFDDNAIESLRETFSLRELKRNYEERLKQHCVHENKLQFSAKLFSDLNPENVH